MDEKSKLIYIGLRVKEVRKFFGHSLAVMADKVGLDVSHLSKIERGLAFLTNPQLLELKSKYNVDLDWLISGEGNTFKQENIGGSMLVANEPTAAYGDYRQEISKLSKELESARNKLANREQTGIPFYNVDFEAGFSLVENNQQSQPDYYINDPMFSEADCVVKCNGDSMGKKIPSGCYLGIKKIDVTDVLYGEIYALVTKSFRTVKYVRKSKIKGHLLLVPENTEQYDAQDYPISKLLSIWQVVAYGVKIG
jgi:transcriptional regulator with XRE-family HTH domain